MHALVRALFMSVLRLYFREISVRGREHVPADGPCLVVANHPNGLIDPLVLRLAIGRPVAFLSKSTLFGNPFGRLVTGAFDSIPVYRQKDGADTAKNEETFNRCRDLFRRNGWLAMFPEGVSHSDPELKPLKTGAARIALSAVATASEPMPLRVLPVGMLYDAREVFRSRVAVSVGEPINVADWLERYRADEWPAVEDLTARVGTALAEVTLQAENKELWEGFVGVAAWTHPAGRTDLAGIHERARALAAAYRRLRTEAPEDADALVEEARRFVQRLAVLGVDDAWSLEDARAPTVGKVAMGMLPLVLLAPVALVGIVLNWLPYRLVRPVAMSLSRGETDVLGTIKVLAGMLFLALAWITETIVAGMTGGPWTAAAIAIVAPLGGFVALRYSERLELRRQLLRTFWLRTTRARIVEAVNRARMELAQRLEARLAGPRS